MPEEVVEEARSYTGRYLAPLLEKTGATMPVATPKPARKKKTLAVE